MPYTSRLAELLLNINVIQLNTQKPFTWESGLISPVYCDTRMLYSHPQARNLVVEALISRIQALHIEPDAIAGTAMGAIGWSALVADRLNVPFVYVRNVAKKHGTQKIVEGDIPKAKHILVLEDLVATGKSAMAVVQALRTELEAVVTDILTIFTYEMEQAAEQAQEHSVRIHAVATFGNVLDIALQQGSLDTHAMAAAQSFTQYPEQWAARNK